MGAQPRATHPRLTLTYTHTSSQPIESELNKSTTTTLHAQNKRGAHIQPCKEYARARERVDCSLTWVVGQLVVDGGFEVIDIKGELGIKGKGRHFENDIALHALQLLLQNRTCGCVGQMEERKKKARKM
jgi:hypothetical protein